MGRRGIEATTTRSKRRSARRCRKESERRRREERMDFGKCDGRGGRRGRRDGGATPAKRRPVESVRCAAPGIARGASRVPRRLGVLRGGGEFGDGNHADHRWWKRFVEQTIKIGIRRESGGNCGHLCTHLRGCRAVDSSENVVLCLMRLMTHYCS